jgi:hypothetical protein
MCEFLRATSAAALALFFATQAFAANNEASREPHALAPRREISTSSTAIFSSNECSASISTPRIGRTACGSERA